MNLKTSAIKTILIQGAVTSEIENIIEHLPGGIETEHYGCFFYETSLYGVQIIISLTQMGIMNACIATQTAITIYAPDIVINQGTAGAHIRELNVGDIIIGETAVYINSTRTPARGQGEGSNALEWRPGNSSSVLLSADPSLVRFTLDFAEKYNIENEYAIGKISKILPGRLGSGDLFSKETDRIDLLHTQLGEICEDMETIAVYNVCHRFSTPVIGIRIISNNEIAGNYDIDKQFEITQNKLQDFILKLVKSIVNRFGK